MDMQTDYGSSSVQTTVTSLDDVTGLSHVIEGGKYKRRA